MTVNKVLYLFVDRTLWSSENANYSFNDNNFKDFLEKTEQNALNHNNRLNDTHPDSGFDLLCPVSLSLSAASYSNKVRLGVRAAMYEVDEDGNNKKPLSYYLYPRSSTGSKTTLRLSNSIGIIDSGYRGELIGVFDTYFDEYILGGESRLLQVCSGDLSPFKVKLVYDISELQKTVRGEGGFGSTGKH